MSDDVRNLARFYLTRPGEPEREVTLAEFLEATASGFPSRAVPSPQETAAADELIALSEELGLYDDEHCNWCQRGGEMLSFEGRLFCGEDCANAWWYEWGTE